MLLSTQLTRKLHVTKFAVYVRAPLTALRVFYWLWCLMQWSCSKTLSDCDRVYKEMNALRRVGAVTCSLCTRCFKRRSHGAPSTNGMSHYHIHRRYCVPASQLASYSQPWYNSWLHIPATLRKCMMAASYRAQINHHWCALYRVINSASLMPACLPSGLYILFMF